MILFVFDLILDLLIAIGRLIGAVAVDDGNEFRHRKIHIDWIRVFFVFTGVVGLLLLALYGLGLARNLGSS